jgi:hypothetical protein
MREDLENTQAEPLAYVYCTRDPTEPGRGDPDEILRSIVRQLSCSKPDTPIKEPVRKTFQQLEEEEGLEPRRLTLDEAKNLVLELVDNGSATIILDALDECDPRRRYKLLDTFDEILRESTGLVKILISSRDTDDISRRLRKAPNFSIDAGDNSQDIERFVQLEVDLSIKERRLLGGEVPPELKKALTRTLIEGAQGM